MSGPWDDYASSGGEDGPWSDYQPRKGPQTRPTNPNRGKSGLRLAGEGARKFVEDVSLGVGQILTSIPAALGREQDQAEVEMLKGIADVRKLNPAMQTTAGRVGYGAAALAPAVGAAFIPGVNTVAGSAGVGAIMGAVQPTGSDDSRFWNTAETAMWGAAGQGAAKLLGRLAQPVKSTLAPMYRRAVETLTDEGVNLTPAQKTGSGALAQVQRYVTNNPITQPKEAARIATQREQFTRAALRKVGGRAGAADEATMGTIAERIGQKFDDVASRHSLDMNAPGTLDEFVRIADEAKDLLRQEANPVTRLADDVINQAAKNGGKLPGTTYQKFKTKLDSYARNGDLQPFAVEMRRVLDDALEQATQGTDDFQILAQARREYANLKAIERAVDADGQISPAKLWSQFTTTRQRGRGIYGRGNTDLARLARSGKQVLVEKMPDSGTAPRAWLQALGPQAVGAGTAMMAGNPIPAAAIAASAWGIPRATQALAGSNYLATGMTAPALRNALMLPSRAGVGALVPAYLLSQQ